MTMRQLFLITALALLGWVLILSFMQKLTSTQTHQATRHEKQTNPSTSPIEVEPPASNEKSTETGLGSAKVTAKADGASVPLSRFLVLEDKVLKNTEEQIEFERLLSNPFILKSAVVTLLSTRPEHLERKSQRKRFEALQYLEKALSWQENPAKEEVTLAVEELIQAPLPPVGEAAKRSMLGDKMELYVLLLGVSPERAKAILETAHGTTLEKALQYASKRLTSERQE